jgi:regulator of sigma E protease
MTIVLFLAILVALIVVHEFGHFVLAKLFKMRVEEFGIGYPPRMLTYLRKDGTDYTLNWLPFGGFVKIFGEDDSATRSESVV